MRIILGIVCLIPSALTIIWTIVMAIIDREFRYSMLPVLFVLGIMALFGVTILGVALLGGA